MKALLENREKMAILIILLMKLMLKYILPNIDKGLYERTVCFYCKKHKLEKMTEDEVDNAVFETAQYV